MNKKVVVMAVALMAMLATPVMAASGGNKVPATCLTFFRRIGEQWENPGEITKGGIWHVGEEEIYYGVLTIDGTPHHIYSYNVVPAVWNSGKGLYVSQSEAIWYVEPLPPSTIPDPAFEQPTSDGFAGKVTNMMTNYEPPFTSIMMKTHVLMHGFGSFDGQTLEFSSSGAFSGFPILWEGFCIKG